MLKVLRCMKHAIMLWLSGQLHLNERTATEGSVISMRILRAPLTSIAHGDVFHADRVNVQCQDVLHGHGQAPRERVPFL